MALVNKSVQGKLSYICQLNSKITNEIVNVNSFTKGPVNLYATALNLFTC